MKILQVSTFFNEHGGVEKAVSDLTHSLALRNDVQVLCTKKGASEHSVIEDVEVTRAGSLLSLSGRPISLAFARNLAKYDVDVAHFHLPCPIAVFSHPFASIRARVKTATWHHDLVRHQLFNKLMHPFLYKFLNSLDSIIVTAPQLIDHTPILRQFRSKCHVIPLGIDHNRFADINPDEVLDQRSRYGTPLLLHVGRLVYYKGCPTLIEAMRKVANAHLVVVGEGPLRGEIETQIREYGLEDRVHLVGWQPESVLRALYQACDIFVLPSTLPTECFGLVQVEAMLCGKPVINTSLPTGVPWVSQHAVSGLTVAPADVDQLSQAIMTLLGDSDLRRSYGAAAKKRAHEQFTLKRHTEAASNHYEELLRRKHFKVTTAKLPAR